MGFQGVTCILTVVLVTFPFLSKKNKGVDQESRKHFKRFCACSGVQLRWLGLDCFWLCCVMIKLLVDCPFEILKFWLEMFLFYRFTFTIMFRFIPLNDMLTWYSTCVCDYFINSTVHDKVVDHIVGLFFCFVYLFVCFPQIYGRSSSSWKILQTIVLLC